MSPLQPNAVQKPRNRKPVLATSRIIRQLFELIENGNFGYDNLAKRAGMAKVGLSLMKRGRQTPIMSTVENLAEAIGYRLVLEKIEDDAPTAWGLLIKGKVADSTVHEEVMQAWVKRRGLVVPLHRNKQDG